MKKLGTLDICGTRHEVCVGNSSDNANLGRCFGVYEPGELRIWLEAGLPKERAADTLVHEVLHATVQNSGMLYALAAALQLSADDPRIAAAEEVFVRVLTPHIRSAFGMPKVCK